MEEKKLFTSQDCRQTGYDISLEGKVVVLSSAALPESHRSAEHQLYFCTGGFGSKQNPSGRAVFAVSLADGEQIRWNRSDILGIAKPEILTDHARLQLSQLRPAGALDLKNHEPQYSGYCFLPDGRYTSGVWLCNPKEVQDYIDLQKEYQHRIMVCDRDDFCVLEMVDGKLIYPTQEMLDAHRKEQEQNGGMELKL
ncbi:MULTISPECIES: hypothetical protein [Eubacteriales]|uniref:hypothetical protein n=1 Tax=Eubacteriales TaxID=186802 RepID=UPI001323CD44|nr:hypothetical protein [Oscillibacter sp.]MSS09471.1 hypothetical protein [Clostridium sp. WB02_MRS01]